MRKVSKAAAVLGRLGGKARAKNHSKKTIRKWGQKGGKKSAAARWGTKHDSKSNG